MATHHGQMFHYFAFFKGSLGHFASKPPKANIRIIKKALSLTVILTLQLAKWKRFSRALCERVRQNTCSTARAAVATPYFGRWFQVLSKASTWCRNFATGVLNHVWIWLFVCLGNLNLKATYHESALNTFAAVYYCSSIAMAWNQDAVKQCNSLA